MGRRETRTCPNMTPSMETAHKENTKSDTNEDLAGDGWVVVSLPFGTNELDLYGQRWSGSREMVCGDEAVEVEMDADQWSLVSLPGEDAREDISEFDSELEVSQTSEDDNLVEVGDTVDSEPPTYNYRSNFIDNNNSLGLPPTLECKTIVDLEAVKSGIRAENTISNGGRSQCEADSWARVRTLIQANSNPEPCSIKTQKVAQTIQRAESTSRRLSAIRGLGLWDNPLLQHDYFTLQQQKMKILMQRSEDVEECDEQSTVY
ncbi:hypothetical protein DFH27DRAFT_282129 [Peziza echinospora]|nr:hypothetical protein DFH27DRAFT_282129 [Peziza echinospora]